MAFIVLAVPGSNAQGIPDFVFGEVPDLTMISNTDSCGGEIICETVYEICDPSVSPVDITIEFFDGEKTEIGQLIRNKDLQIEIVNPPCKRFTIRGEKSPFVSIDNIPCVKGICDDRFTWWNATWDKKKAISINVSDGSTQTDIEVYMNITYDSDMKTDFSDLRFLNNCSDDAYLLPYCLGSDCIINENFDPALVSDGNYAESYIRIPIINTTICMYYDNPNATSLSNPQATFHLFDDFESGFNTSLWTSCPQGSVVSGQLVMPGPGSWIHCISNVESFEQEYWETMHKSSTSRGMPINHKNGSIDFQRALYFDPVPNKLHLYAWNVSGPGLSYTWNDESAWWELSTYFVDDAPGEYKSFAIWNGSKKYGNNEYGFNDIYITISQNGGTSYTEWVRIRKYYEPVITVFPYNEQIGPGIPEPPINITEIECPAELVALCSQDWTSASCSGDILNLENNCSIQVTEGNITGICSFITGKSVHCQNGCYENLTGIGAGCAPTDIEVLGISGLIFIGFMILISFLLRGKKR